MAIRVQINNAEAYRESHEAAFKLVQDVVREVRTAAFRILIVGPYTEGRLALGLKTEVRIVPNGVRGRVYIDGNIYPYAKAVEGGADPDVIRPRAPRTRLKFFWRKVGHVVYLRKVNHPGQKGKAYLRGPLIRVGTKHGMIVITHEV